jgi:hypothetical protein
MDELEKKEGLELAETVAEESVEEATEEVVENITEEPAEEVAENTAEEEGTPVEKTAEKGGNNIIGIIVGFALFIAFLALVGMAPVGGKTVKDTGVFYAKENDLYYYDMKNEPYLVQEDISAGGSYNYFYSAWGAGMVEEGDWAYYTANVDETGAADLYCRDMTDPAAQPILIDSDVVDYKASKDGSVVAYLAMPEDSLQLRVFDGGSIETVGV